MAVKSQQRPTVSARKTLVAPDKARRWPWPAAVTAALALVMVSVIAVATVKWGTQHFQQRLDDQARAALLANDIDASGLSLTWKYRDLTVAGELPVGVSNARLRELLRSVDQGGIRQLSLLTTEPVPDPAATPATGTVDVAVRLQEGVVFLTGTVLSRQQRDRLREAARNAVGDSFVDQLKVSGLGESIPGSDERVESLANSIAGLDHAVDADAARAATDFRFSATVSDENDVDDLLRRRGVAGDLGLVISGDIIARKSTPGGVLEVDVGYDSGRISLTGVVLSDSQKALLVDAAAVVVGADSVSDEIIVASAVDGAGVAEQRVRLIAAMIADFPNIIEADVRLGNSELRVDALLEYEEDSARLVELRRQAELLGLTVAGEIQSRQISLEREVAMLQEEIDALTNEIRETVVFDSADDELDFVAKQTLDKIVDAMNRYQRPVVDISGHTDDTGSDDENRELSLRRASSVSEYLRFSGIEENRLRALGLGESSHIANNQTEFGKKQNRRVEFRAQPRFNSKP